MAKFVSMNLGDRLRFLRKKKDLTLEEMSKIIGVSNKGVINNWEKVRNKPMKKYLVKYAEYFDVSLDWLIYGDLEIFVYNIIDIATNTFIDFETDKIVNEKGSYVYLMHELQESIKYFCYTQLFPEGINVETNILIDIVAHYVLFGEFDPRIAELSSSVNYSQEYMAYISECGYDDIMILKRTINLFYNNLNELDKIRDNTKLFINKPNINKIMNKLKSKDTDIPDGIYEAIDKLLD